MLRAACSLSQGPKEITASGILEASWAPVFLNRSFSPPFFSRHWKLVATSTLGSPRLLGGSYIGLQFHGTVTMLTGVVMFHSPFGRFTWHHVSPDYLTTTIVFLLWQIDWGHVGLRPDKGATQESCIRVWLYIFEPLSSRQKIPLGLPEMRNFL